jgi:hypothetical protein
MTITREQLASYLEDALSDVETAQVEMCLRQSEALRQQLLHLMRERDRGEHSVGAIWRRQRLTCQSRAQLGSYLLGVLDPELNDYIHFHLQTIGCSYCLANLADLKTQQQGATAPVQERRRRYFDSSAALLHRAEASGER